MLVGEVSVACRCRRQLWVRVEGGGTVGERPFGGGAPLVGSCRVKSGDEYAIM